MEVYTCDSVSYVICRNLAFLMLDLGTSEIQRFVLSCIHSKNDYRSANIRFAGEKSKIIAFLYPKNHQKQEACFHVPPLFSRWLYDSVFAQLFIQGGPADVQHPGCPRPVVWACRDSSRRPVAWLPQRSPPVRSSS